MFSFLNRSKQENPKSHDENLVQELKKSLYDSLVHRRTDILVSLLNQWFKSENTLNQKINILNTNFCENETTSPLLVAYSLKDKDLIRTLLNFGADPSLVDFKYKKNLIELINESENDSDSGMKQLLSDSFMQAIVQNNLIALKQYLSAGFRLNIEPNSQIVLPDNNSYLHWACIFSIEPIVRLLLENGADVNALNKNGAIALHEALLRKDSKQETLRILETLLIYKSDTLNIKGIHGVFKDLSAYDLAKSRSDQEPEMFHLIKEFLNDHLTSSNSSVPHSPLNKTNPNIIHSLDSISQNESSSSSSSSPRKSIIELEHLKNWSLIDENQSDLSKLWPQPKLINILSELENERFRLPNSKTQPLFIYFKPPFTYSYMDMINKLASAFSSIQFYCIHKPIEAEHIQVNIDSNLFMNQSSYSILVTAKRIDINACDTVSLQYALFTLMQLCKIYSRDSIPSLRIIDYSDVKYRSLLLDFSQGFYFKYENLLALLQMFAYYKINQVHFYVKFSSLPPLCNKKQWYHYIENWFGLMKFCEDVNLEIVPSIDITNDVAELCDVLTSIKEYLELFTGFKFINIGPRLSSLLTCMDNKNPFNLESNQHMMLCSYLYHNGDQETLAELEKFDKYILMEYGLKSGTDFGSKSINLYKSGRPFYLCVGSSNWNTLLGCPDGCLNNINDALKVCNQDRPLGLLLCNFVGSIHRNSFAFNLNSILMFSGLSWNTNTKIDDLKLILPSVISTHGLINDKDGELAICMLELGNIETYLSRKANNSNNFDDLPYDDGSLFVRLLTNPDDIDLNYLDKNLFRKSLFQLRAQQTRVKSLLTNPVNDIFREASISAEITVHLFRFLITLFNTGTKHQSQNINKAVGLNVINVGVSNLSQTVRTDLANKLIIFKEELKDLLESIYYAESIKDYFGSYFVKLIDKLLIDQDEANLSDLTGLKMHKNEIEESNRLRSFSQSSTSAHSSYFVSNNDDNQALLFKK